MHPPHLSEEYTTIMPDRRHREERNEIDMITNEVLQCLKTRRSVRQYLPKQVDEDQLAAILAVSYTHLRAHET